MSWFACPVCTHNNAPGVIRCTSCGAEFDDPDLLAMMGSGASVPTRDAPEISAGSLSHGKFLGLQQEALEDGSAVRKLAIFGALLLLAAFFIPISHDFEHSLAAWKALDHAPSIPLIFPALAAILGLVAVFAPLEAWQKSVTLLVCGLIGLGTLPFLGGFSGSPQKFMPVLILGIVVGSWGLILRSFNAQSNVARYIVIAGAVLTVVGFFIPMSNGQDALPIELQFFLQSDIGSASPIGAYSTAFNKDPMVFFSVLYLMLPLFLVPVGAALSWAKPTGAWDKSGTFITPIAWLVVLYAPIGFALFAFNLLGYEGSRVIIDNRLILWEDFSSAALTGRFRLFLLAAAFSAWATLPIVAVAKEFLASSVPPSGGSDL